MTRIIVVLAILLPLIGVYFFFTALRCARLLAPSLRTWRLAGLALGGMALLCLIPYLFFGGILAMIIAVIHLTLFQLLVQGVRFIIRRALPVGIKERWDRIYRSALIPILCVTLVFAYGSWNMRHVVRTEYVVKTSKRLPESGVNIALLSDVHFGMTQNETSLAELVDRINRDRIDIAILCGDIFDEGTTREGMQSALELLGGIDAEYGVYFVYGNHDRASYRRDPKYSESELRDALERAGIAALQEEYVEPVEGLILLGREDRRRQRESVSALLQSVDRHKFILLADHQPTGFAENARAGVDLQLSGHTHGGQFFPMGYINTRISDNELCYGMERVGDMSAIVSSGVSGWGIPLRTQARSEYLLVKLIDEDQ